ncbi:MerR family transcriptional regulator [Brevibacillus sp. H7]|uniref:MerR family transcriptional regulator n=1 Tax=Brevibacillus sp. H7 TaxID=3349138 RepID=UPI003801347A
MMPFTVKEVSHLSGVSVRTLHYYDEIGLLKPAFLGENGYRYYEEEQLLLLQQILFFRELDLSLVEIKELMHSDSFDRVKALQAHRILLQKKAERLQELMNTIDKTIDHLKGEIRMPTHEMYQGFSKEQQEKYIQEIKDTYGKGSETYIDESVERTSKWKKEDWDKVAAQGEEFHKEFAAAIERGEAVDSPEVQKLVQKHFEWINNFYTPTKEVYAGLGDLYVDHPDFRKFYEKYHPQLAEYLRDAIKIYADQNL